MSPETLRSEESTFAVSARSPLLTQHMPGLDVLRGIAVLVVVLYHGLYWGPLVTPPPHTAWSRLSSFFTFGWLGVFLFFVLSGFLITGILLDTKDSPSYWRSFYIRRALRILPAFLVVVFLIKVAEHASWPYVALCLFNLANLAPVFHIGGYTYFVLWSLAVEEQFYLVWPWVVKSASRTQLILIMSATLILSPVLRFISFKNILPLGDVHGMTWLISDNLIAGAALAVWLRSADVGRLLVKKLAWILLIIGTSSLVFGIPFGILHRTSAAGATFQTVPFEFLFASALLFALLLDPAMRLPIALRPLRFLGNISYGLYLFHELVFEAFFRLLGRFGRLGHWSPLVWGLGFLVESSLAVAVAYISKRFFEDYFLSLKSKLAPSVRQQRPKWIPGKPQEEQSGASY
ncbi:acyltransferase [Terriglobus albidus]|uniref:Acyltransferase n=1 Tax=Terriglobus albidus TaxID=1592106 RepID=A0A5B9EF75_9BACT|nr:acyltransferase [Terriglobus albidus]QEE30873.1 acyltransferase [Terriglobus albidus]